MTTIIFAFLVVLFVPLVLAVLLMGLIGTWTAVKCFIWDRRRRRARQRAYRETHGPDGTPCPPVARGICQKCGGVFERIYFLPDGRRLCEACYAVRPGSARTCVGRLDSK